MSPKILLPINESFKFNITKSSPAIHKARSLRSSAMRSVGEPIKVGLSEPADWGFGLFYYRIQPASTDSSISHFSTRSSRTWGGQQVLRQPHEKIIHCKAKRKIYLKEYQKYLLKKHPLFSDQPCISFRSHFCTHRLNSYILSSLVNTNGK